MNHAKLKPQYQFLPMQESDLDAIMQIEPHIYSHPWTHGNFADSLKSGYPAYVLKCDAEIIGYALMMMVLDEAHLLNLGVAKAYQKQGFGRLLLEYMIRRRNKSGTTTNVNDTSSTSIT